MLGRMLQPGFETLLLLLLGDVEKKLHDHRSLLSEHPLKLDYMPVASLPYLFRQKLLHPHGNNILVVAAVEDRDLAIAGNMLVHAPEEIASQFSLGRLLEGLHADALRVHPQKNMFHTPVLPPGVHGLNHNQDPALVLRVQDLLQGLDLVSQRVKGR